MNINDLNIIKDLFKITDDNPYGLSKKHIDEHLKVCEHLPMHLSTYYQEFGNHQALNNSQDKLLPPDQLRISEDGNHLVFYQENQCVCVWGIKLCDLTQENPNVFISYDEQEWIKEADTLTDFLLAMAHLQAVFGLTYATEEFIAIDDKNMNSLINEFEKKPINLQHWIGIQFFGKQSDGVIAVFANEQDFDLMVASSNKCTYQSMLNKLTHLQIIS